MPSGCSTASDTESHRELCAQVTAPRLFCHMAPHNILRTSVKESFRPSPYLQQPPIIADPGSFPTLGAHRADTQGPRVH